MVPIFYDDTVHTASYVTTSYDHSFSDLTEEQRLQDVFQPYTATAQMVHASLKAVSEVFSDCIISRGLWPPLSLHLIPCNSYLRKNLEDTMYKTNPYTLEEPSNNIHCKISAIPKNYKLDTNVFSKYTEGIQSGRQYFQHLLLHCNSLP
jgi:hypothetical protein